MGVCVEPADATLGAVVTGVRLGALDESAWPAIEQAFLDYGVLIFPGQHLTADEQFGFAERFGEIEYLVPDRALRAVPFSNRRADGTPIYARGHGALVLKGNEGWHTDSSYMPLSAKASVLSAVEVVPGAARTEWADMRAAYDALDRDTVERISGLSAYHSLFYSQGRIDHRPEVGAGYGFYGGDKPLRPLVKVHPVTGRPALYIGRHAYGIPGLSEEESESLLDGLADFACRPPRTFVHEWRVGDTAIWDNRCVMHRARPCDPNLPRVLVHTRVAGDPATELAPGMTPQQ